MKIVVLDGYTLNPGDLDWDGLNALGEVTVYDRTSLTDVQEVIERVGDAEVVYTNKTPMPKAVFDACPNIEFVGVLATGYNGGRCGGCERERNPRNQHSYLWYCGSGAVCHCYAVGNLSHVAHHSDEVHKGRWETNADWCFWDYPLIELAGKTMGVIGFGRIGQATGRIAKALGMRVIANDEYPSEAGKEIAEYVTREELYAQADVIALHCPLFPSTEGMINKESIARMKDGVIILNNSRGPLIVEQDLADALNYGKGIRGWPGCSICRTDQRR